MSDAIAELVTVLGLEAPVSPVRDYDWDAVEARLGTRLPDDHKYLMSNYPDLELWEFIWVIPPETDGPEQTYDLAARHAVFTRWMDQIMEDPHEPEDVPYPAYDGESGILCWGMTPNGDECAWYVSGGDPDTWDAVIVADKGNEWFRYPGGITGIVRGLNCDGAAITVFPEDWPDDDNRTTFSKV